MSRPVRPPASNGTVPDLLASLLRSDPTRPAVTWFDADTGARIELSVATLANWVAKTGGFLQDGLDVAAGDRVRLGLPTHWQVVTWALGCWAVGAVVEPDDVAPHGGDPEIEVFGEDRAARTGGRGVVVGLAPFGGPARARAWSTPGPVVDAGAEVLGHPDVLLVDNPPVPESPALVTAGAGVLDQQSLLAQGRAAAAAVGLGPGGRLLASEPPSTAAGLVQSVVAPLVVSGSVLLVNGRQRLEAADALTDLAAREDVDVVAPSVG